MLATDLDGTLLDRDSQLSPRNREALTALGEAGVLRVITTGRSLYSARQVLDPELPIDYLCFSSGAGTVDWKTQELIDRHEMTVHQTRAATTAVLERRLDFMIHRGIPDNHHFVYHRHSEANPDFERRCQRYRAFAAEWDGDIAAFTACELIAIEPPEAPSVYDELRDQLADLTVILATSPLDHTSRWIEIFPPQVSKSQAARAIARRHHVGVDGIVAVGNDFNDRDLLDWATHSFVVANAPEELRARHHVVAAHDEDGFAEVAAAFLAP